MHMHHAPGAAELFAVVVSIWRWLLALAVQIAILLWLKYQKRFAPEQCGMLLDSVGRVAGVTVSWLLTAERLAATAVLT